jgi:hypothetical protein
MPVDGQWPRVQLTVPPRSAPENFGYMIFFNLAHGKSRVLFNVQADIIQQAPCLEGAACGTGANTGTSFWCPIRPLLACLYNLPT